jgi:hypothetical protein
MNYLIDSLDEQTTLQLDELLRTKLEDVPQETHFFESSNRTYRDLVARVNVRKSEASKKIINLVKPIFEKSGLTINEDNGYIEYKSYSYDKKDSSIETSYNFYSPNELYTDSHECIIITHKDDKLKRGDLIVYRDDPSDFLKLIGYEKATCIQHETFAGMVIISSGDTVHEIDRCHGQGLFNYITITLYSKKREGCAFDNDDD